MCDALSELLAKSNAFGRNLEIAQEAGKGHRREMILEDDRGLISALTDLVLRRRPFRAQLPIGIALVRHLHRRFNSVAICLATCRRLNASSGRLERFDVSRRQLFVGPPPGLLSVDPDVFVGLSQGGSYGFAEAFRLEIVLGEVGRIPAVLVPVVVHPDAEARLDVAAIRLLLACPYEPLLLPG